MNTPSKPSAGQALDGQAAKPIPLNPEAKPIRPAAPAAVPVRGPTPAEMAPVGAAKVKARHRAIFLSFLLSVLMPVGLTGAYLWGWAANQYASYASFQIHNEQSSSALDLLGGLSQLVGASSSAQTSAEVLYEYDQSQELVQQIDRRLDLRNIWSKPGFRNDPIFAYHPPGTIEDLVDYWNRMVQVSYDASTGIVQLRVLAFDPDDAKRITEAIVAASTDMINRLSDKAREDAVKHTRSQLADTVERLKAARGAIAAFRNKNQIVDPSLDITDQVGLVNSLQQQLAATLVSRQMLAETAQEDDPRIALEDRRIKVINSQIAEERRKLGRGPGKENDTVFANIAGEYESLQVDLTFAQSSYTAALAAFDGAQAVALRQSTYLAAHIQPSRAEESRFPQRFALISLVSLFLFLVWSIAVLVVYSLKDRR